MKMSRLFPVFVFSILTFAAAPFCSAASGPFAAAGAPKQLQMCDLLSDHAVLQRSEATHVWGRGRPARR